MVKIQKLKRAQYLSHLPLTPYSRFPTELATIILLAISLFASFAALSQCLCSESPLPYLLVCMLHEYHVIYCVRDYPRFYVTAVVLGTYYLWIRGHTCILEVSVGQVKAIRLNHLLDPIITMREFENTAVGRRPNIIPV
jgi:hypothetical protein